MILLKDSSVIHDGLEPEMYYALGVASGLHKKMFGTNCVVTSLLGGVHNAGSKHPSGYAVDIRTMDITDSERGVYIQELKDELEPMGFDVVPEKIGSTPATTQIHAHIEFDPHDRKFWHTL
jgi:hypothetical protein